MLGFWYNGKFLTKKDYIHIIDVDKGKRSKEVKKKSDESLNRAMFLASELGIQIAFPIVLGVGLGYWIDKAVGNTQPIFTLSLLFFGIVVSFYTLFKKVRTL